MSDKKSGKKKSGGATMINANEAERLRVLQLVGKCKNHILFDADPAAAAQELGIPAKDYQAASAAYMDRMESIAGGSDKGIKPQVIGMLVDSIQQLKPRADNGNIAAAGVMLRYIDKLTKVCGMDAAIKVAGEPVEYRLSWGEQEPVEPDILREIAQSILDEGK